MQRKVKTVFSKRLTIDQAVARQDIIYRYLPGDYADVIGFELSDAQPISSLAVLKAIWSKPPAPVQKLLAVRNALVRPLGLKITGDSGFEQWLATAETNQWYDEEGNLIEETVISSDDRHLAFHVAIKVTGRQVMAITVVHLHNWLGRAYFMVIKPFHEPIVRKTLIHVLTKLQNDAGGAI